jgi:AAA+ superfamily predicted ATPase
MSDITVDRNYDGSFTATALVEDDITGFPWYHHEQYFGYGVREVRPLFRESILRQGFKIVKDDS